MIEPGARVEAFLQYWELPPSARSYIDNNVDWTHKQIEGETRRGVWIKGTVERYNDSMEDYLIKIDEQYEGHVGWEGDVRGEGEGNYWWVYISHVRRSKGFIGGTREQV